MSNTSNRTSTTISSASHSGNHHVYDVHTMAQKQMEERIRKMQKEKERNAKRKKIGDEGDGKISSRKDGEKESHRSIGRWKIGETLGKGGYSWVKKGYDRKTSKCVALKFMRKADSTWAKEQSKQVVTEIECLKQIRHKNVLKLYAYNLNAKYPTSKRKFNRKSQSMEYERVNTILLVLEYAPGGEIFDILYYTRALESVLARTYFRQAVFGLEACHNAGVSHRDIKPQNLLLDSRFNLKICDFGLSKLFESDADAIMETSYVGTRGYQAPELLLKKSYDLSCDIFSMGVVLFILITGYPPFEQASPTDRWFKPMTQNNPHKFWRLHKGCAIRKDAACKDLLTKMLAFDPNKRISINKIKKHPWFNGKYLEGKDLIRALRRRHHEMEVRRREDGRKIKDLQTSIPVNRAIKFEDNVKCEEYPINEIEGCNDNEQYTQCDWKDVISTVESFIAKQHGTAKFDKETQILSCEVKMASDIMTKFDNISFDLKIYQSREYVAEAKSGDDSDTEDDGTIQTDEFLKVLPIFVVKFNKTQGTTHQWTVLRNEILTKCQLVITGLPKWAKEVKNEVNQDEDDYEQEIDGDGDDLWDDSE